MPSVDDVQVGEVVVAGVGVVDDAVVLVPEALEYLEQLVATDVIIRAYLIYIIYVVPVESVFMLLIVKKTVVLVNDCPESLEIALRRVVVFDFVDTRSEK